MSVEKSAWEDLRKYQVSEHFSDLYKMRPKLVRIINRVLAEPPQAMTDKDRALCDAAETGEDAVVLRAADYVYQERHPPKPRTVWEVERDMLAAKPAFHLGYFDEIQKLADERRRLIDGQ